MTALLSICIPTYNRADDLAALLARLAQELGRGAEQIVVQVSDNASDDATAQVLRDNAAALPRLQVHRQGENLGAAANIRWLIEHAPTTEYLWLLGDDDLVVEGGVQTVVDLLRAERPAWLHLPHLWVDENGQASGGSPAPGSVQRYETAGDMYRGQHHWLTFMSASVVRRRDLQAAVREVHTDNAFHPLLWFFRAGHEGPCVVAADHLLHGSCRISWADRKHVIQTIDFTSLYDEGLHTGMTAEQFGATLDGLYVNGWGFDLWQQMPIERLAAVVARFPQSTGLRGYLWQIACAQGDRDVLPVLDRAGRAVGADIEADELVRTGEEAFAAGDAYGAAQSFLAAARRMPTCIAAWNDLAVAAHQLGQRNTRDLIETALFLEPDSPDALINRAALLLGDGDLAAAGDDASRVLEIDPDNASAQQLLALTVPSPAR